MHTLFRTGSWAGLLLGAALLPGVSPPAHGARKPAHGERILSEFRNDDGSRPDGRDSARDDSSALKKALAAGPGTVRLGAGIFRVGGVSVPEGVTLVGEGKATLLRGNGDAAVFRQVNAGGWAVRDLVLDGEATGDWHKREDTGKCGIRVEGCWDFEISGVTARNFAGAGVDIGTSNLTHGAFTHGGTLARVTATGNAVGVRFSRRGEYVTATQLNCYRNAAGCVIRAGNTNIATSNFGSNVDGVVIDDLENGSHGSITGCLVNHNERYALLGRGVQYGMAISNCCFFYGTVRLERCSGVTIAGGLLSCNVETEGPDANRIAGNHIIPEKFRFTFAPATLVRENFTKTGPWELNR